MNKVHLSKTLMSIAASTALACSAQDIERYPEKPVRVIVPFAPGGGTDLQARELTRKLDAVTGQSFIVDNRIGSGGVSGVELVQRAAPDGYTMAFASAAAVINATAHAHRLRLNPVTDLTPITWFSSSPMVLVVSNGLSARSVTELVALARRSTDGLMAGINVPGSISHLSAKMFLQAGNFDARLVPFTGGGGLAMGGLVGGHIDFLFATGPVAGPQLRAGRVRGLAVTTRTKSPAFADLPTMASFFPGFEADNWYALFFPAGTPKAIVDKMNAEIRLAAQSPQIQSYMGREGLDAVLSTPERLTALLKSDIARYTRAIDVADNTRP